MIVLALPNIDGHFKKAEQTILEIEQKAGCRIAWVLCPGNLGIWPDSFYMDKKCRGKAGTEFADRYIKQIPMKHPILFVRGPHEDHYWLRLRKSYGVPELLPNLIWLADGYKTLLPEDCRVLGLGGVYSPKYYDVPSGWKTRLRAYRRKDVEKACSAGPTDILLTHASPECKGIKEIIYATRPKLHIYSSIATKYADSQLAIGPDKAILISWKDRGFELFNDFCLE